MKFLEPRSSGEAAIRLRLRNSYTDFCGSCHIYMLCKLFIGHNFGVTCAGFEYLR